MAAGFFVRFDLLRCPGMVHSNQTRKSEEEMSNPERCTVGRLVVECDALSFFFGAA